MESDAEIGKNWWKKSIKEKVKTNELNKKKNAMIDYLLPFSSSPLRPSLFFNFPVSLSWMPVWLLVFYLLFVFLGPFRLFLTFLYFFYAYAFIIYFSILQFTILPVRKRLSVSLTKTIKPGKDYQISEINKYSRQNSIETLLLMCILRSLLWSKNYAKKHPPTML